MATQSDVNDLIRRIRATKKAKVVKAGSSKHMKVLDMKGRPIVDDNGPLILSGTPGDERMRALTMNRLIKAGIFTTDPYKETRKTQAERNGHVGDNGDGKTATKKRSRIADPDVQEAKVRAIKAKSERMRERTAVLRGRLEPIISKLGGWGSGGRHSTGVSVTEFGEVVFHWATQRGRMELPKKTTQHGPITAEHVASPAGHVKRPGSTIGEKWLPLFEVFVDELERNAGVPVDHDRAAARYRELLREAKGLSDGPTTPAPLPPPLPRDLTERVEGRDDAPKEGVGPMYDQVQTPAVALKALWYMARGASETERDDVIAVADELADLELNCKRR